MRKIAMKVFISWSGDTSLKIAQAFREWLPYVINSIEPYVSSEDIDKGARWSTDIAKELEDSTFGILCVTKDNMEAPWISFEAGALSKTMNKSYVTPFLFDIKRSEVQGPMLQFQCTIYEKEDIKKMVNTLNKACGNSGIAETRLEKSFDVWYPTLEKNLEEIKQTVADNSKNKKDAKAQQSEILEEILELSRDNQKLLRTPDIELNEGIESIKDSLKEIAEEAEFRKEKSRIGRRYNSMLLEDVLHSFRGKPSFRFLMILGILRDDLPWIYDMGKELLQNLNEHRNIEVEKSIINNFKDMIDFTLGHPAMRELFMRDKNNYISIKELSYLLFTCLDDMLDELYGNPKKEF